MKKRTGLIIGGIVLAILLFVIWPREDKDETHEVETAPVTEQDFSDIVSTVGTIEPVETESLIGQGMVNEVNVKEGEEVDEDDVLVTYADGNELTAPFSGTITELNVQEEETDMNSQQNEPSVVIADVNDLEVVVALSKSEANKVKTEQTVELTYLEDEYEGEIEKIDPMAAADESGMSGMDLQGGQDSPTLKATIRFTEDKDELDDLVPGFDIDADIHTETSKDALGIPIESLLYENDGTPYVFLVVNDKLEKREVETGIQEGVAIEITDGLELEDEVVQLPSEDLEEGTEVTVVDEDDNEEQSEDSEDSDETDDDSNE